MNIQMILAPHKHVRFCDSLVGLAGFLRGLLSQPRTLDELWSLIDRDNSGWLSRPPFEHLILAVDILFALQQIEVVDSNSSRIKLVSYEDY
ncbi:MAG: ABC-three component system middle component 6 [Candidatus Electrothrix sp. YB6]